SLYPETARHGPRVDPQSATTELVSPFLGIFPTCRARSVSVTCRKVAVSKRHSRSEAAREAHRSPHNACGTGDPGRTITARTQHPIEPEPDDAPTLAALRQGLDVTW